MWYATWKRKSGGSLEPRAASTAARAEIQKQVLAPGLSRDFMAPPGRAGARLAGISVRDAVCLVPRIPSLRREYRRKVRTITRRLGTLYVKRGLLNPFRYGVFSWILASQ